MKNKRLGIGLIVVGVVGLAVLLLIGNRVSNSAIKHFGRVNVGCQVTFTFPSAGTYFVYVEEGKPRQHNNGCEPSTRGDALTVVVSKDGTPVELTPDLSVEYSADGVTGQSQSRFQVEAESRFQVTVTGPDTTPSVAMGIDPDSARRPWRLAAGLVGALGVIGGAVVLAVGRRTSVAERDDRAVHETALAPPPPQSADVTSPTGIDVRKPKERATSATEQRASGRSPNDAKSKPPYLPASAVAAVEARRRSSAIPSAPQPVPGSRDQRGDSERVANTTESPIVPPKRPPVEGGSNDDRVVEPPKPPKRGVPVVSSGSSRRRPITDIVPSSPIGAPDRSTQPPSRTPAQSRPPENPVRTEKPSRQVSVPANTATPPVVETVGDVLGDLAGATPPAGTARQPERVDGAATPRTPRQPHKELPPDGPPRPSKRRRAERPAGADRPTSKPAAARRQPGRNGGLDSGSRRPRRPPVVGDFLDEITVGDVLDDGGGFTDAPPRRRRRRVDDGGVVGGSTSPRDRSRRGSRRRDADGSDYLPSYDDLEDAEADGFDDYDAYDDIDYAEGIRRRDDRDASPRRSGARSDRRNSSNSRPSARPRPDRGPEPMRDWGNERTLADEESFLEHEPTSTKPVVPPPPPPIRKPPPLPEPDGDSVNGNGPSSVEDEWHDAGDDTGAWRWWSPPDPRNRR